MALQLYAIVDPSGNVDNLVLWDGVTLYSVAPNTLVLAQGNAAAQIGGTYLGGVFTPPAVPPPPQGIVFLNSPASGAVVQLPNAPQPQATLYCILEPSAALASLTLDLGATPQDGDKLYLFSTKAITALALTPAPGQVVNNAPTSLTALVSVFLTYSAQYQAWFKL
jgi:hypothetical protein